jgi:hypothetical protein
MPTTLWSFETPIVSHVGETYSARACGRQFGMAFAQIRQPTRSMPINNQMLYSLAVASTSAAPTAERASRNASRYGFTRRRCANPKLLMARPTAPMLSGFRGRTSTTRRRSNFGRVARLNSSRIADTLQNPADRVHACAPRTPDLRFRNWDFLPRTQLFQSVRQPPSAIKRHKSGTEGVELGNVLGTTSRYHH